MSKKHICILFVLIVTCSFSQERDFLFGQLVDSTQNDPIAFASIRIKDRALGVISNIDGTFKIPLRYKELGEVLEISCLGFESKTMNIKDLDASRSNIIILKPSAFELTEAVVSANIEKLTAKQIVRIAVNSIPQNYPSEAFGIVGYYRDYQVKNGNYSNLGEAIINVLDKGFHKKDNRGNQYQLYSYNQNSDFEIDSFAKQPYDYEGFNKIVPNARLKNDGGNEFLSLVIHDAIRNYGSRSFSFIHNLASDFIDNHKFRIRKETTYDKEIVYEIDLSYRNENYLAEGKIFINVNSFAIHKLDYAVYKRKKPNEPKIAENDEEKYSNGFRRLNREILYRIQIEYVPGSNDNMFLNYISFYNKILIKRPPEFKSKFVIDLDYKYFRIRLNKTPKNVKKIRNKDFKIFYKDQEIPIDNYYFLKNNKAFLVCPDLKDKSLTSAYNDLFTETDNLRVSDITYSYGNIVDSLGNQLDYRKMEYLHQYREFFAQEIVPIKGTLLDSLNVMNKLKPLDSPLQPIYNGKMKDKYWKNTPLPTLSN